MIANSSFAFSRNAGTGETARKNLEAFQRWSIVPKRLIKTAGLPDISTDLPHLGMKSPAPIAVAPVGVQRIFNPDGERASAAAAAREGVPYVMSTASSTSIEDVAKANGNGVRFFQLYWASQLSMTPLSSRKRRSCVAYADIIVLEFNSLSTMKSPFRSYLEPRRRDSPPLL